MTGSAPLHLLAADDAALPIAHAVEGLGAAGWILWFPLLSFVLCGLCWALRVRSKLPAWITVACLAMSFGLTVWLYAGYEEPVTIHLFDWFDIDWSGAGGAGAFLASFSLYVDKLTLLWMLFVTGLGTLIALYASEYMEADLGRGYARFFAGVSVFLFAMSCLVMGDNLLMLYLGWEGVGFASYWLIGYYYQRPSAVEAAKKAFIVNRIGDLGLALGLYLTYHYFGTIQYTELFTAIEHGAYQADGTAGGWPIKAIPFLLMLGAFGKSAQLPLYVWLPDAMEGPTPVSALIHAATMVTAGVYLLARMYPVMMLHPAALPTVAWVGGLTALLAATIAMAQYDIKRIMAYSTVSQLGYMFMGVGVLTAYAGAYHVFTHAFFKAVLFLTCGAIMHGFAGQLDLRRISGLRRMPGWGITSYTMLYGCLCLVGFPLISSGYYSKDAIMAEAFVTAGPGFKALGVIALLTALLTAYYTFRVWFRVCAGETKYEMGDEHHGDDEHGHDDGHGHDTPHAPRFAINFTLIVISLGAVGSIVLFLNGWGKEMIAGSTAAAGIPHEHEADAGFTHDPHRWMPYAASAVTLVGLAIAYWLHLANRKAADRIRATMLANPATRWLPTAMENKWYVDELYHALIRMPLWVLSHALKFIDRYFVDLVVVDGIARTPRWVAKLFQPLANGVLQSYAVSMAGGIGLIALLVLYMPELMDLLGGLLRGGGRWRMIAVLLLIIPLLGAVAIGFAPVRRAAMIAFATSCVAFLLSVVLAAGFDHWSDGGFSAPVGMAWLEAMGVSVRLHADAVSMLLVLLTTLIMPLCIAGSFTAITSRVKEYYAWMLIIQTAMTGVFLARDLVFFYVCFEFTLVPMFFLIAIYGGEDRARASIKFFIYTFTGSMLTLAGLLYVAWQCQVDLGRWTFDIPTLTEFAATGLSPREQGWILIAMLAGFAVKVPLFPVHTWLPLAHTEAPTAGSVILAAVLLKLGTYGLYRFVLPMVPDAVVQWAPAIATLAIIGIIYAGLICWVQSDVKKLIAYSSVSHLGFCVLGLVALNPLGVQGSVVYMLNHGLSTGALFLLIGMIYERYHTRDMNTIGGLAKRMPVWAFFMVFFVLSSVGLPGLNGFVSEFLCLVGAFTATATYDDQARGFLEVYPGVLGPWYAAFAGLGMIVAAMYLLIMVGKVVFGPLKEPARDHEEHGAVLPPDLTWREISVLVPLAVLCVVIGFKPGLITSTLERPIEHVLAPYPSRVQEHWTPPSAPPRLTLSADAEGGDGG